MPAINVAKTDTFEIQRQKINQIGANLFQISAGGSDLATGNLKLGDGTKNVPSLSFTSDSSLGLYKPDLKSVGFVSGSKRILDIRETALVTFKDINVQNKTLFTAGITISNSGSGYDSGTFTSVTLDGGTGSFGEAEITVEEFVGEITQEGIDYIAGDFTVPLNGGNGSGAIASFSVPSVSLGISNPGAELPENTYTGVSLTNGSGTGLVADITTTGPTNITGTITNGGSGYLESSFSDVPLNGGSGDGNISASITVLGGTITSVTITNPGLGYQAGDTLSVDDLDLGGNGGSGFVYTLDTVDITGVVTLVTVTNSGQGYRNGDVVSCSPADLGNVNGTAPSFTIASFSGTVQNFSFDAKGSGYQVNDILSLPGPITGISTDLSGQVSTTGSLDSATTTVTVASTTGIVQGMEVSSDGGELLEGTTVQTVNSSTTLTLSQNPVSTNASANLTFRSSTSNFDYITISDTSNILVNSLVTQTAGTGILGSNVTVQSIIDGTTLQLSANPTQAGTATLTFDPPYGTPTQDLQFTVQNIGAVAGISITNAGTGYDPADILTVSATDLVSPIVKIVIVEDYDVITPVETNISSGTVNVGDDIDFVGDSGTVTLPVIGVDTSGGFITSFSVLGVSGATNGSSWNVSGAGTSFTIDSVSSEMVFNIDGSRVWNNEPLYVGNTYSWDLSDPSNAGHQFALSRHPDGSNTQIAATGTLTASSVNVPIVEDLSTLNILPGMEISTANDRGGAVATGAKVVSVDIPNNQIIMDNVPVTPGAADLLFTGTEMLIGVTRTSSELIVKITDETPSPLYVYCPFHLQMGVPPEGENVYVVDPNNPKVFGSGAEFTVTDILETSVITADVETGTLSSVTSSGSSLNFSSGTVNNLIAPDFKSTTSVIDEIRADSNGVNKIDVYSGQALTLQSGNFNIGSNIQITNSSGDIETTGEIKSTGTFNSNDRLTIQNSRITANPGYDLELQPSSSGQTRIFSTSALVIPAGNNSQRPIESLSYDGAIRFNTETQQYEGYSSQTTSWTSLGGVRDIDGNTQILAEETVGANDDTLWFYNDGNNTLRLTTNSMEFVEVKNIRSVNVAAPDYINWVANSPVDIGDYLKYRNDIYEVVTAGLTGTSGNEPDNRSGDTFSNGSAELRYFTTAVSSLVFDEISEIRIDPLGFTDLVVNNELRFSNNIISSNISDILIKPKAGQKVVIDAKSSLVIPVGDNNSKGNPTIGSIRYNTDDTTFEGFDGSSWGSLGGIKDVDGNTYIIPETSPGSNENILYFYNNANNTLRVTENQLEFDSIDTITSTNSNSLTFNASLLIVDNAATSLDNTSATETFLFSTKDNFDIGMSSGLVADPILRFSNTGDVFYNIGYGTGTYSGVKVFDNELKEFEIADYKIVTKKADLQKGPLNQGDAILYDPSTEICSSVRIVAHNTTTGDKEYTEYVISDDGVDIYYTEVSNVSTGENQIDTLFDFNTGGQVRVTYILDTNLNLNDSVEITVISQIIKK